VLTLQMCIEWEQCYLGSVSMQTVLLQWNVKLYVRTKLSRMLNTLLSTMLSTLSSSMLNAVLTALFSALHSTTQHFPTLPHTQLTNDLNLNPNYLAVYQLTNMQSEDGGNAADADVDHVPDTQQPVETLSAALDRFIEHQEDSDFVLSMLHNQGIRTTQNLVNMKVPDAMLLTFGITAMYPRDRLLELAASLVVPIE
jgi:hypothetical protein